MFIKVFCAMCQYIVSSHFYSKTWVAVFAQLKTTNNIQEVMIFSCFWFRHACQLLFHLGLLGLMKEMSLEDIDLSPSWAPGLPVVKIIVNLLTVQHTLIFRWIIPSRKTGSDCQTLSSVTLWRWLPLRASQHFAFALRCAQIGRRRFWATLC